jgi:hydroxypyruvate reductase
MTPRPADQLRRDALAIWQAGLAAVRADRLVQDAIIVDGPTLLIDGQPLDLDDIDRIAVVGAGKAGAGMAAGLETALGPALCKSKRLYGWINVPEDCVRELEFIHLHAARPAGVNEPTEAGVLGTSQIIQIVESLGPRDLCLALISGGGSALLPLPAPGVTLADKQALTRYLSSTGANIAQLNTVRKQLSQIKGSGLARRCRAERLIALIISDVIGDPLDLIASGPTVADASTPRAALDVLEKFGVLEAEIAPAAVAYLGHKAQQPPSAAAPRCSVRNIVIGNNAVAVDAAGVEAERRGYSHAMSAARALEGPAEDIGRHLATMALRMRAEPGPDCLITGGEPTVALADPSIRGRGGRNQQLVLAALEELIARGRTTGIALLSGGTDGEDGPTDAAGAFLDEQVIQAMQQLGLDPADYLRRSDAYHFFEPLGALLKTGPTHTNVCDVRVVVVDRIEARR